MAQIIQIKRSDTTTAPASLNQGELAYSSAAGSDKLFIGNPGTGAVTVIGGKIYVDMLDHTAGTLTDSSAVIVDASGKVDRFNVDNITLDGNSITSTDLNGDLLLTPNGSGSLVLDGIAWPSADGSAGQVLTTDGLGNTSWSSQSASTFDITGDTGTDTFSTGETLTITGGDGIFTTVTDNQIAIAADIDGTTLVSPAGTLSVGTITLGTHTTGNYVSGLSGTLNEIEVSAASGAVTIGLPDSVSITSDLTVGGNLTVNGTVTAVNTETVTLADNIVELNSNYTGSTPTANAGLEVNRGTLANSSIIWNETVDKWQVSSDNTNFYTVLTSNNFESEIVSLDGGTF